MWIVAAIIVALLLTIAWYVFNGLAHGADKAGSIIFAGRRKKQAQRERDLWAKHTDSFPE